MREILFHGKRVANGEWVTGYYANVCGLGCNINETRHYILEYPKGQQHEIYTSTLGQYTGLTDRNGKKIFEGDIVRCNNEIFVIGYYESFAAYTLKSPCNMRQAPPITSITTRNFEVIGNIYDNPELLEGGASDDN